MQKKAGEVRACAESKILEFKSDTAVLIFSFRFLSFPHFLLFLPHFFSLAGHLVGFILVGRVLRKAFRILGLGERKDGWAIEQDFHGYFQVNLAWFFCLFLRGPWLNCAHAGMVWKISSLCASWRTKLSLTVKTDDVTRVERTWIHRGGSGANGLRLFSVECHTALQQWCKSDLCGVTTLCALPCKDDSLTACTPLCHLSLLGVKLN